MTWILDIGDVELFVGLKKTSIEQKRYLSSEEWKFEERDTRTIDMHMLQNGGKITEH